MRRLLGGLWAPYGVRLGSGREEARYRLVLGGWRTRQTRRSAADSDADPWPIGERQRSARVWADIRSENGRLTLGSICGWHGALVWARLGASPDRSVNTAIAEAERAET